MFVQDCEMLLGSLVGSRALEEGNNFAQGLFAGQVGGGPDGGIKRAVTHLL